MLPYDKDSHESGESDIIVNYFTNNQGKGPIKRQEEKTLYGSL